MSAAEEIFLALADLPPTDRETSLRERCGPNRQLRAEVDALLATIDAPDDAFLDPSRIPALDMNAVDGPLQPGTVLGRFLVLHAIGSGGMGVVYAAQQDRPRRTVAIKVLRRGFRSAEIVKRFEREANLLARLQHPGIAQVFAFHPGNRQAPAHLVMELVSGPPITEYARVHALSRSARVALIVQVCEAMQHAHDRGVIHRDLKPANVLVAEDGRPKVLDFGIARATGRDVHTALQTSHGQLLGTLASMSPEQLRGASAEVDARTDVYAIGVLLYQVMTGRMPFDVTGLPLLEAVQHILQSDTPRLQVHDAQCAGSLDHITARAMAREREARHQSAAELAADLRAHLEGRHIIPVPPIDTGEPAREPIAGVQLRDDGSLIVTFSNGRQQRFEPSKS